MAPDLEKYLWDHIPTNAEAGHGRWPRNVIKDMLDKGMIDSAKQAWRTLEKWCNKRKYDYGVTLDLGWKVDE